jgi:hypothetical protein
MGFPGTGNDVNQRLGADGTGLPKSVCVLPFHYTDVLLQGETKQLRLYEEHLLNYFTCHGTSSVASSPWD